MIKYAFDSDGKFKGRFTETDLEYLETAPASELLKPVVNTTKTGWIEGLTSEELSDYNFKEQEKLNEIERGKIEKAKVKAYVESQLTVSEKVIWFPEWVQKAYAIDEKVSYKGKPFNNAVDGNINAPDKGGWIEIK